ncbi:MAG: PepSY domain-containing protein [Devosia sp.]
MRRRTLLLATLMAIVSLPARADDDDDDDDDDHDDALRAVDQLGILELDDLLRRFAEQIDGRVVDVRLDEDDDEYEFRVTYVAPDGYVRRVTLDAVTGRVIDD